MQADSPPAGQSRLREFLEQESDALLRTIRLYVVRARLADQPPVVQTVADELLNEVTVEALVHADRFDPEGQPRAWLLGIAANLIKRRQVDLAKRQRREPLARDLAPDDDKGLSDDELFDRLASVAEHNPAEQLESDEQVRAMLLLLPPPDREVIRLAVLSGLDGHALAGALGISPGAARVRLHRALNRLREALTRDTAEEASHV